MHFEFVAGEEGNHVYMRLFGSTWAVQIVKGFVIPPKSTTVTIPST